MFETTPKSSDLFMLGLFYGMYWGNTVTLNRDLFDTPFNVIFLAHQVLFIMDLIKAPSYLLWLLVATVAVVYALLAPLGRKCWIFYYMVIPPTYLAIQLAVHSFLCIIYPYLLAWSVYSIQFLALWSGKCLIWFLDSHPLLGIYLGYPNLISALLYIIQFPVEICVVLFFVCPRLLFPDLFLPDAADYYAESSLEAGIIRLFRWNGFVILWSLGFIVGIFISDLLWKFWKPLFRLPGLWRHGNTWHMLVHQPRQKVTREEMEERLALIPETSMPTVVLVDDD